MERSAIIGWNLPNFVTFLMMILIIWVAAGLASHFWGRSKMSGSTAGSLPSTATQVGTVT